MEVTKDSYHKWANQLHDRDVVRDSLECDVRCEYGLSAMLYLVIQQIWMLSTWCERTRFEVFAPLAEQLCRFLSYLICRWSICFPVTQISFSLSIQVAKVVDKALPLWWCT